MSVRKKIDVHISDKCFHDILDDNTPDEIIDIMAGLKQSYEGRDIFFKTRSYGYDGGIELQLWERRPETDREYQKRVKAEEKEAERVAKVKQAQKDKEYADYLKLKKKFGD